MKLTRYFPEEEQAYAFASGLEEANDGNIHTVTVCKSIAYADQYVVGWHNEDRRPSELPEKHPPLTPAEYVERKGNLCPVCRGRDITGDAVEVDERHCYQPVSCLNPDCEASWIDCYELSGYDSLER